MRLSGRGALLFGCALGLGSCATPVLPDSSADLASLMVRDRQVLHDLEKAVDDRDAARAALARLRADANDIISALSAREGAIGDKWPLLAARVDDYRSAMDRLQAAIFDRDRAGIITGIDLLKEQCSACHKDFGGGW